MPRFQLPTSLAALQHRNFRLLWFSLLFSMSGSRMRMAALLWHITLVVPEDQKALALGAMGLARFVPILVFSFVSGMAADALDRRRLLLITNLTVMLISTGLAVLTFTGLATAWWIYALAGLTAAVGSFDSPARQSLYPTLVPRRHLANAVSLNSLLFQTASVIGPMIGGLLIAGPGLGWVYVYDAASFIAVIAALLAMRDVPDRPAQERGEISLRALLDGVRFVFGAPLIRSTMLLDFFATFFAAATALLPIFAQDVLRVGPQGYGALVSAPALGAMLTSLAMVPLIERIGSRGRVLIGSVLAYGLATIVFGLSTAFWLTFACLFLTGATDMISTVLRNVVRQMTTPDNLRGRMTSINMIFFLGGPELGEMEAGLVAQWLGPAVSVVSGGVGCLLATGLIAWSTPALRGYRRDELLPAAQAAD